jgi:hypothetical protein
VVVEEVAEVAEEEEPAVVVVVVVVVVVAVAAAAVAAEEVEVAERRCRPRRGMSTRPRLRGPQCRSRPWCCLRKSAVA